VTTIRTTRNYNAMFEDMISAALWPPDTAYATFTTGDYPTGSRGKGYPSLVLFGDAAACPLIGWYCKSFSVEAMGCQLFAVTGHCEIHIACRNEDPATAARAATRDLGKAAEAISKQGAAGADSLAYGPFYLTHPTAITGMVGTVFGLGGDPKCGDIVVAPDTELGGDVVTGVMPVSITVWMD
jgi:hypothetical protein